MQCFKDGIFPSSCERWDRTEKVRGRHLLCWVPPLNWNGNMQLLKCWVSKFLVYRRMSKVQNTIAFCIIVPHAYISIMKGLYNVSKFCSVLMNVKTEILDEIFTFGQFFVPISKSGLSLNFSHNFM
jgi:hypothetical protein